MDSPSQYSHRTWVSPIATISFIVLALTGIPMLFHYRLPGMNFLHQWTGALFVMAGLIHLILNWKMLVSHFNKKLGVVAAAFALVICIALIAFHPQDDHRGPGPNGPTAARAAQSPQGQRN